MDGDEDSSGGNCSSYLYLYVLRQAADNLWRYIPVVVLLAASVCSIVINLLLIITLCRYNHLRKASNKILLWLSVSDFLIGLLVGPVTAMQLFHSFTEDINCIFDSGAIGVGGLLIQTSTGILAFISYDRYLHISQLHNYKMTKIKLRGILFVCWMLPIFISSTFFFDSYNITFSLELAYLLAVAIVCFACYITLLIILRRHSAKQSANISRRRRTRKHQKIARTVGIILTCNYIMIGMQIITLAFYMAHVDVGMRSKAIIVAVCYMVCNSALNPLLFSYNTQAINRSIRKFTGLKYSADNSSSQSSGPKNCMKIEDSSVKQQREVAHVTSRV